MQLFAMALLLYSCSENETPISDTTDNQARLNFLIKTAPTNKALIHGDDGSFSSLALYIFNKADRDHLAFGIPDHFQLQLFPSENGLFDQNLSHKARLQTAFADRL